MDQASKQAGWPFPRKKNQPFVSVGSSWEAGLGRLGAARLAGACAGRCCFVCFMANRTKPTKHRARGSPRPPPPYFPRHSQPAILHFGIALPRSTPAIATHSRSWTPSFAFAWSSAGMSNPWCLSCQCSSSWYEHTTNFAGCAGHRGHATGTFVQGAERFELLAGLSE